MAWRAAASLLSFAVFLVSVTRSVAVFARNPYRVLGAGVIAGILAITAFGAVSLLLDAAGIVAGFV